MIELRSAGKLYQTQAGPVRGLRDITLTIGAGEFVAIVGPRSAGKSTLFNLIGCLDTPSSGSVTFLGTDTRSLSDRQLARLRNRFFGHLFEDPNLVPELTARENVELPLIYGGISHGRRARVDKVLTEVGAGQYAEQPAGQIPLRHQQRVAIARALVNNPDVVLADEPTGSLDAGSGEEVISLLTGVHAQGRTVVLLSADVSAAPAGARVIHLAAGTIPVKSRAPLPTNVKPHLATQASAELEA